jgi:hypothetical protein
MNQEIKPSARDLSIARLFRSLGRQAMTKEQAKRAAQLLQMHWSSVYRLRKRFLLDPVATSVARRPPGPRDASRRLDPQAEEMIAVTLAKWLPKQRSWPTRSTTSRWNPPGVQNAGHRGTVKAHHCTPLGTL